MNDFAHNEWQAPANTYLEPNTDYGFALECVAGCANDNKAQFGRTHSKEEDSGFDANGVSGDAGGEHSGFDRPLPTTKARRP